MGLLSDLDRVQVQGKVPSTGWIGPHPPRLSHGCRSPRHLIIHTNQNPGCRLWPCRERQKADTRPACPRRPCPKAAGHLAPEPGAPRLACQQGPISRA